MYSIRNYIEYTCSLHANLLQSKSLSMPASETGDFVAGFGNSCIQALTSFYCMSVQNEHIA